jgi:DNA-binding MarR family transcriptional regulator
MKYIDKNHIPTDRRPLGFWLRAIEGPLRENMRNAFATFGVTRREWRTLTTLHAGPATLAEIQAGLPPRREHPGRDHVGHGPRGHRTLEQLLDGFVQRGWATLDRGSFALTAEGERIHDAVLTNVQTVRAQVTAGIPDADYATTMSTLEKIAGNVGWQPGQRPMRHRGPRGHLTKA